MSEAIHIDDPEQSAPEPLYEADPYEYGDARDLMEGLELAEPVAITLVRRGHRTVAEAREFLEAATVHDGAAFEGIGDAVSAIGAAIEAGRRITVHGDYDVDGMAATAILISGLRRAEAECDWVIPDRVADGYGLSAGTVERLAERGTELLITADCGIASPDEIAAAKALGIEAIVTDHHRPGERLPDCLIVHPEVSGYPFAGLCGAAVAHKLVEQLELAAGGSGEQAARDLDLVALATIADLVPLVDENRTLARRGIAELRRARRPGIRALMAVARVEPERLDEGDIAFRIAPRLNAAGRLYRADAGVELMLADDDARAKVIAAELDAANHERRQVEREVSAAAAVALKELPEDLREASGVVLAGQGWHPGVVGIAASRMVERLDRPAILLAIDDQGRAKGSGRSVPGFDLLAAIGACSEHLIRFGGHRAAAGLELEAEHIDDFRRAFAAAATEQLPSGPAPRVERIDAVVGAEALGIGVAEQLEGLGPFGQGNPEVRFLVPWANVGDVRPMGEGGRHARFSLGSGGARAAGVAFNSNGALSAAQREPSDLTVRLEVNQWNGAVEPRAVLEGSRLGSASVAPAAGCACRSPRDGGAVDEHWWGAFEAELDADLETDRWSAEPPPASTRRTISHSGRSAVALIGELLSSGGRVLALCADSQRRADLVALAGNPARFGGVGAVVCGTCPPGALAEALHPADGPQLVLADWGTLAGSPGLVAGVPHVVLVDPPPSPALTSGLAGEGAGYLHEAFSGAGELPALCWAEQWQPRGALAEIYRGLIPGPLAGEPLGALLAGGGARLRHPEVAARCVRVLGELGLAELAREPHARELRVVSSEKTELERSRAWRALTARHEDGLRFLQMATAS